MKSCPYCAEQIQDAAVKCRYCGSDLRVPPPPPTPSTRTCSACAEDIDAASDVCPLCGTDRRSIPETPAPAPAAERRPSPPSMASPPPAIPAVPALAIAASPPPIAAPAPAPAPLSAAPTQPAPSRPPSYWTAGRIVLALIALPAVFVVAPMLFFAVIGALGAVSGGGGGGGTVSFAAPNFVIGSVDSNDDCAGLTDYCVRGSCTIINSGDGAGAAQVEMALEQDGGQVGVFTQSVSLAPGERKTVTHDFGEARLMGDGTQIACRAR